VQQNSGAHTQPTQYATKDRQLGVLLTFFRSVIFGPFCAVAWPAASAANRPSRALIAAGTTPGSLCADDRPEEECVAQLRKRAFLIFESSEILIPASFFHRALVKLIDSYEVFVVAFRW